MGKEGRGRRAGRCERCLGRGADSTSFHPRVFMEFHLKNHGLRRVTGEAEHWRMARERRTSRRARRSRRASGIRGGGARKPIPCTAHSGSPVRGKGKFGIGRWKEGGGGDRTLSAKHRTSNIEPRCSFPTPQQCEQAEAAEKSGGGLGDGAELKGIQLNGLIRSNGDGLEVIVRRKGAEDVAAGSRAAIP